MTSAYGSGFHPPLKVPSRAVRVAFQATVLLLIGAFVLRSHALTFDLTPWTQVIINRLVDIVYSREGQRDTTVLLFQERNLQDFGDPYPVPYARHVDVLEALARYEPRSVFIDFAFIDERPDEGRLLEAMRELSGKLPGGLYLAAPFGGEALGIARRKFEPYGVQLVSAGLDQDEGVSGVLTYSNGIGDPRELGEAAGDGHFMPSPAFAMAQHRTGLAPADAQPMEIIWPSGKSVSNDRWMCLGRRRLADRPPDPDRLIESPLAEKKECPYTTTVSVAHLLGSFDRLVDEALRGRAVFYGAAFVGAGDRAASPVYHDLPGVYLHAMAYDNLVSLRGHYKRADRGRLWSLAEALPLAVVVAIWVWESNVRKVGGKDAAEKPREWISKVVLAHALMVGVVAIVAMGIMFDFRAVLLSVGVPGYLAYRWIMHGDWLGILAALLLVLVAGVSFFCLDVGPRNIVGYLAMLEVARRLGERLDEMTRKYLQLRGAPKYDDEWGGWAKHRGLLDRVIGLWVQGSLERTRHERAAAGSA